MSELQIFKNEEFGEVRTVIKDGQVWFAGNDIAKALGYAIPSKAINTHCKGVSKMEVPTNGGKQEMLVITEGDIYRLVVKSQLPQAEKFESWIYDDVLPSIRKNGGYIANQENLSDVEILANAVLLAQNVIANKDKLIEQMKPKAEFFDQVADSKSALPMDKVAKVLEVKGVGRNKLFEILREKRILDRNNVPYQSYVDRGYFRVVEQKYNKPDGSTNINIKTLVYQRGLDYIRKLLQVS